jgi:uncharacterized membrane-anchored protein YhcB (DUF1043 family)
MTFDLIVLMATLLVGVLIGCTLSEQLLEARTRRQAATQRSLNSQWQELASQWRELEAARQGIAQRQDLIGAQTVRVGHGIADRR